MVSIKLYVQWSQVFFWGKSHLVPRFSSDLNLILRFLISRIKSLGFASVSNRSLCYFTFFFFLINLCYFTIKVNGLPSATCVSFNMSASTSTTLISATSYIYILLRRKKNHCVSYQNKNSTPRLTPHYQSSSNRQSSSMKTTKKVRSVASVTKNYLGFFFRNKLKN